MQNSEVLLLVGVVVLAYLLVRAHRGGRLRRVASAHPHRRHHPHGANVIVVPTRRPYYPGYGPRYF